MSFNYLLNTLDGSVGCKINNSELSNASSVYYGKVKNENSQCAGFRTLNSYKNQIKISNLGPANTNISIENNFNDKKLRFSEKLRVLLKNGESKSGKNDLPDPYAFSDVDVQQSQSINNTDSFIDNESSVSVKASNGTNHKSIALSGSLPPQATGNSVKDKDCNSEAINNTKRNMKLAKFAVPLFATNNLVASDLNQANYKVQLSNPSSNNKMSNLRNNKTCAQLQLSSNNKPSLNKLIAKTKLQNVKTSSVINTMKPTSSSLKSCFGQIPICKQGNAKMEKKLDKKHKSFQKGKSLLNQLQKTALLNRPVIQQMKKNTSKPPFFGMSKNSEKQSDMPTIVNSNKKSLLEESLLGLKNHRTEKDLSNGMETKSKSLNEGSCYKDDFKSFQETGNSSSVTPARLRTDSLNQGKHESLERIWNVRNKLKGLKRDHYHFGLTINDGDYDDNSNSECLLFQNYWFSVCGDYDSTSNNDRKRDLKLSQLKIELRHKIKQLQWRYKNDYRDKVVELLVESARKQPNLTAFLIRLENSNFNNRKKITRVKPFNLLRPILCTYTNPDTGQKCEEQAMPCVKFCQQHITCSNDQLLFTSCSAMRSDSTSCQAAVLNQSVDNPLCLQHKRLVNMSEIPKKLLNTKPVSRPSQPRKRSRSSTGCSSRSGRNRKRKRSGQKDKKEILNGSVGSSVNSTTSPNNFNYGKDFDNNGSFKQQEVSEKINPQVISRCDVDESQEVEVSEEVLAIAADLPLELATQATKLLEEHDFTNVLNHIPADAFNDLFTEDKEEYEPTPQETEELERALEAVDKDVKSLEKLSQTQGILDTLLDEQTIAQTLAQLPEVTANIEVPQTLVPVFYQNGFSNINQLEQTLQDVNKSLTQTVLLNQGNETITNHFNNLIPNQTDVLQS